MDGVVRLCTLAHDEARARYPECSLFHHQTRTGNVAQAEVLFEKSGFIVTGNDEGGLIFSTVGTVGLSADEAVELSGVLAAWLSA